MFGFFVVVFGLLTMFSSPLFASGVDEKFCIYEIFSYVEDGGHVKKIDSIRLNSASCDSYKMNRGFVKFRVNSLRLDKNAVLVVQTERR